MPLQRPTSKLVLLGVIILSLLGFGYSLFGNLYRRSPDLVSPPCLKSAPVASSRTFYVDPIRGTDAGNGSVERPWRNLQRIIDAKLVGSQFAETPIYQYWIARILGTQPTARIYDNPDSIVGDGDTILLATGDYGPLNLRGIINRAPITISGAPGANARFSQILMEGTAHFAFKDFEVSSKAWATGTRHLVNMRPEPRARRSNGISFSGLRVGGQDSIANLTPEQWAKNSNNGFLMFGDCLNIDKSKVHDVHIGVSLYHVTKALVSNNEIHDYSVDGIDFSGNDIVIRNNVIRDHWPTGDALHPDCMQGQSTPHNPTFGPVLIEHNVCLSDTSARHSKRLQGINIFDGKWVDVKVECNFVRPTIAHGISMYGVNSATIANNIVIGWPDAPTAPWISSMPSKEGRYPVANLITNNQSTAYLNAVHGAPFPHAEMIKNLRVNMNDPQILQMLSVPISGVRLVKNEWLSPAWDLSGDTRFKPLQRPTYNAIISVEQAKADLAALPGCAS
ncbi:right-handed parallel beta-helix repeat-containing protein [Novosphingobium sp. AAP83]|uniref:right-handed parallel beta-helix repeat-containing protein n=1 Tax=Novosphingobium sp. AAP83 TaxID=1523425 RepID=UPI0009E9495A|nr:right-handed parallel beta-helix repeat-containing protein [Novosphingobium sp. AAP83]